VGRADQQVKVRGYRIELGEIESALRQQEQVEDAVVVAQTHAGEQRLVAYVIAAGELNASELRTALQKQLPEYMTPAAFVQLTELPLTPNGKVDRSLLLQRNLDLDDRPKTFVAPRTLAELQLVRIWEDTLGLDRISVHDNFFELGGHSLLAVRLMSRIRQETKKQLPLELLFRAQTVEQLATHLRDETPVRTGPLVKLQDGTRRPFFCVHPVGGNVLCYAELARALGADQPVYGIQAAPPESEPPKSIEQMARSYVEAVLTVQPHGPYLLGGWSMGGLIAFEMARVLERRGETVSLLALVDATPPKSNGHVAEDDELDLLLSFALDLGVEVSHETWPRKQLEQLQTGERLSYLHNLATTRRFISPDFGLPEVSAFFEVFKRNITAIQAYKPAAHSMKTVLFRPSESASNGDRDGTGGWSSVVGNDLEVHVVPGNHYTIMRAPQVKVMGEKLRELLALHSR
jgi:thioesterase domain-containing protein/acyl carrier protein